MVAERPFSPIRPALLTSLVVCAFLWSAAASDLGETLLFMATSFGEWLDRTLLGEAAGAESGRAGQALVMLLGAIALVLLAIGLVRGRGRRHEFQGWLAAALLFSALPLAMAIAA
jgi:hypothetical protein